MIKAEIISIGDELLIGQVVNTNASWMAVELNKAGIGVVHIEAISDDSESIKRALDHAADRADVVLITGGLGPTRDDITKHVLADYFHSKLVFHEPSYEQVKRLFHKRNRDVLPVNRKQAEVPDNCIPLLNIHGTAPGMWFEKEGRIFVSMPGVPYEMKTLMSDHVIPMLKEKFGLEPIYHKTIMTFGMGESRIAEKIAAIEDSMPAHIKLAYLPQPGMVRIRLSASGLDRDTLLKDLNEQSERIRKRIPSLVFGYNEMSLEKVIGNLLKEQGRTMVTAESCTGGYLAHLITSIPGSSAYFLGSIIAYANEVKIQQLGVKPSDLDQHGAVSKEVVEAMARGARETLGADYALSTSGVAGPDGGTEEKPVGTVWVALATPENVSSKLLHLGDDRGRNIRVSALAAMNMLRLELIRSNNLPGKNLSIEN
jgi:nicotinamide-nucleotide amidase